MVPQVHPIAKVQISSISYLYKKTIMRFLPILLAFLFVAMAAPPKKATIMTNAQCGMCKTTIENAIAEMAGVKKVSLDLATKEITVKFSSSKVSLDDIRAVISRLGYQADDLAPDAEAQAALSECCKPKPEKTGGCCADKKKACGKSTK